MSLQAGVQTDVRRIRERFLCEGALEAQTLLPSVLDSWRRSQAMRVHPDRLDLPYVRQPDTDSRLAHAAEPVLRGTMQDVTTEAMTVILTGVAGILIGVAESTAGSSCRAHGPRWSPTACCC